MNLKLGLFWLAALGSVAAMAIPEPYYMRTGEMEAIVKSPEVKTILQSEARVGRGAGIIDGLRYLSTAHGFMQYRLDTGKCALAVKVQRQLSGGAVGPGKILLYPAKKVVCP